MRSAAGGDRFRYTREIPERTSVSQVDQDQFQKEGYLIQRGMCSPRELEILRSSYENLVDRQRKLSGFVLNLLMILCNPTRNIYSRGTKVGETRYHFGKIPLKLTLDTWYASWMTGHISNGRSHS